jgi:hypothetical protein
LLKEDMGFFDEGCWLAGCMLPVKLLLLLLLLLLSYARD